MSDKSPKYEREIAEILDRMDRQEPRTQKVKRQARQATTRRRAATTDRLMGARGIFNQFGATAGWVWVGVTFGLGLLGLILSAISPIPGDDLRCADVPLILQSADPPGERDTRPGPLDDVARPGGRYPPARLPRDAALPLASAHGWRRPVPLKHRAKRLLLSLTRSASRYWFTRRVNRLAYCCGG